MISGDNDDIEDQLMLAWDQLVRLWTNEVSLCVCVCVCVRACVHACLRVRMHVCVCALSGTILDLFCLDLVHRHCY